MSRIYDWLETQNVSSLVAVECGALDFADTRRLAKLFSKVLAFEANPSAKAPADLPANVIVELQALAPTTGVVTFFVDDNPDGNSGASSLLPATPSFLTNYIKKERPVRVSSISLADALAKHGLAAARHARAQAEAARQADDRQAYVWWLEICRALDRRMASELDRQAV
jgi:hypothetical protein